MSEDFDFGCDGGGMSEDDATPVSRRRESLWVVGGGGSGVDTAADVGEFVGAGVLVGVEEFDVVVDCRGSRACT